MLKSKSHAFIEDPSAISALPENNIQLLGRQIRRGEESLRALGTTLRTVVNKYQRMGEQLQTIKLQLQEYEQQASEALVQGDENLAIQLADKIADLDHKISQHNVLKGSLAHELEQLKNKIRITECQIFEYKHHAAMTRSTESAQKGTVAVTDNSACGKTRIFKARAGLEKLNKDLQNLEQNPSISLSTDEST